MCIRDRLAVARSVIWETPILTGAYFVHSTCENYRRVKFHEIRPSSRKYPYIDFRPAREIGNEVLSVEGLTKTIDGVKAVSYTHLAACGEDVRESGEAVSL